MMAVHHVPPQIMEIMPSNVGGVGHVEKAAQAFVRNELLPLQKKLQKFNYWIRDHVITFNNYTL